jgi:hypothetical protein
MNVRVFISSLYSVYSVYIGVYYVYRHVATYPNFPMLSGQFMGTLLMEMWVFQGLDWRGVLVSFIIAFP